MNANELASVISASSSQTSNVAKSHTEMGGNDNLNLFNFFLTTIQSPSFNVFNLAERIRPTFMVSFRLGSLWDGNNGINFPCHKLGFFKNSFVCRIVNKLMTVSGNSSFGLRPRQVNRAKRSSNYFENILIMSSSITKRDDFCEIFKQRSAESSFLRTCLNMFISSA